MQDCIYYTLSARKDDPSDKMNRFSFGSLRVRLILLVLVAIIPSLIIILLTGREARRFSANNAKHDALQLAIVASGNHDLLIESTRQLLAGLAHLPELRRVFRRVLRLTAREWALLATALPVVVLLRLGLWLLPFKVLRSAVSRLARPDSKPSRRLTPKQVAWAVRAVSRCVPRATCLTQALATQAILAFLGFIATLRIGVAPGANGALEAHAWLEYGDRIIIGWETRGRFTPFPPIEVIKT